MSTRIKFFLGHLLVSVILALLVIAIVFFVWYPFPLAKAVGVTQIFLMLIVIDVIIGPLLGLLVYKEGKKTLKMDLVIIILIQLAALSYGVFSIAQGRPVWIVYTNIDRFELVRNIDVEKDNIAIASQEYKKTNWLRPHIVALKKEKTIDEQNKRLFNDLSNGISAAMYPERYTTFSESKLDLQRYTKNLKELKEYNSDPIVSEILKEYPSANSWLPLKATAVDMVVLINKEKAEVVKIVDLRPWN
ncbi:TfpX/TfpZ family type IV pilin accessory protein [Acinetobacter sp. ANC 4648]|uniref:TfpX/TfpZ family type IV pilin accessory protein n=1 Tax=Acinetobacter sp. ANC 4648 TaxID=1977875 RepID=UPI000A34DB44|nr:TfpX/TfpZ family type IV pilin accessory protein [Acinetobacter sp. ANC 4648]OTG80701.1 type IV pilin accessory protein [Acinetobacter sp. ANC 4648]